jgi:hypothetical protein
MLTQDEVVTDFTYAIKIGLDDSTLKSCVSKETPVPIATGWRPLVMLLQKRNRITKEYRHTSAARKLAPAKRVLDVHVENGKYVLP